MKKGVRGERWRWWVVDDVRAMMLLRWEGTSKPERIVAGAGMLAWGCWVVVEWSRESWNAGTWYLESAWRVNEESHQVAVRVGHQSHREWLERRRAILGRKDEVWRLPPRVRARWMVETEWRRGMLTEGVRRGDGGSYEPVPVGAGT